MCNRTKTSESVCRSQFVGLKGGATSVVKV